MDLFGLYHLLVLAYLCLIPICLWGWGYLSLSLSVFKSPYVIYILIVLLLQKWVICVWGINIKNWNVIFVDFSFDEYIVFPIFLIIFGLKSILLDIWIVIPDCFHPFMWKIIFQSFTLRQFISLILRHIDMEDGSWFYINFASLYTFIGKLSPLMLRDIDD